MSVRGAVSAGGAWTGQLCRRYASFALVLVAYLPGRHLNWYRQDKQKGDKFALVQHARWPNFGNPCKFMQSVLSQCQHGSGGCGVFAMLCFSFVFVYILLKVLVFKCLKS